MNALPTEALILAGGLGTRLRSVVSDVPKPMAEVSGKPFLAHVVEYWIAQGITRFVLSVGYKSEVIEAYFGAHYNGAAIGYCVEPEPLGTGGGIHYALTHATFRGTHTLILNGDTIFLADGAKLAADAARNTRAITLSLKTVGDNNRYGGVVVANNGQITAFESNRGGEMLINAGCYLVELAGLKKLLAPHAPRFSFEEDVLKPCAKAGLLAASIQEKPFLDIGIPDDYQRAAEFLSAKGYS